MPLGHGFFTCNIVDMSDNVDSHWELVCRSKPHRESAYYLAPVLKRVVSANIPKILDDFEKDDDSVGDLTLGWQHTIAYPLAVYAKVETIWKPGHDAHGAFSAANGSYYVVHISEIRALVAM